MIKIKFILDKKKYIAYSTADKKTALQKLKEYTQGNKIKIKSCKEIYSDENSIIL